MSRQQARKAHQEEIFTKKYDELKDRYESDKVKLGKQLGIKTFDMGSINSYDNPQ